eukprot:RCo038636
MMDLDERPVGPGSGFRIEEFPPGMTASGGSFGHSLSDAGPPEGGVDPDDAALCSGPLPGRMAHKNWKVRKAAYDELARNFSSGEFSEEGRREWLAPPFPGLLAKAAGDPNANAQESALDCLLAALSAASAHSTGSSSSS